MNSNIKLSMLMFFYYAIAICAVLLTGCNSNSPEEAQTIRDSWNYHITDIYYIHGQKTNLCYAIYDIGSPHALFTNVPCDNLKSVKVVDFDEHK